MAVKYPEMVNVRLTDNDLARLTELSEQLDIPKSTLLRQAMRWWLKRQEESKDSD